jgi:hypothetical protein
MSLCIITTSFATDLCCRGTNCSVTQGAQRHLDQVIVIFSLHHDVVHVCVRPYKRIQEHHVEAATVVKPLQVRMSRQCEAMLRISSSSFEIYVRNDVAPISRFGHLGTLTIHSWISCVPLVTYDSRWWHFSIVVEGHKHQSHFVSLSKLNVRTGNE